MSARRAAWLRVGRAGRASSVLGKFGGAQAPSLKDTPAQRMNRSETASMVTA
jgi:hypothetical protein